MMKKGLMSKKREYSPGSTGARPQNYGKVYKGSLGVKVEKKGGKVNPRRGL